MRPPMRLALERHCAPNPSKTNWRLRGTQRPQESSCQRRSSAWASDCAWELHSSRQTFPVAMSLKQALAVHTC
eukprot:2622821-Amphidinium_carterae.2